MALKGFCLVGSLLLVYNDLLQSSQLFEHKSIKISSTKNPSITCLPSFEPISTLSTISSSIIQSTLFASSIIPSPTNIPDIQSTVSSNVTDNTTISSVETLIEQFRLNKTLYGQDFFEKYTIDKELGRGGFGIVYSGINNTDSTPVAIKIGIISKKNLTLPFHEINILNEIKALPGVLQVKDFKQLGNIFYLITNLIQRSDGLQTFSQYIKSYPCSINYTTCLIFIHDIASILHSLHTISIYHNDVKDANILIDDNKKLTLIDFGLSRKNISIRKSFSGSPFFSSPQAIRVRRTKKGSYSCIHNEVWAVGMILVKMVNATRPSKDTKWVSKYSPTLKSDCPVCVDLLIGILKPSTKQRWSLVEIMEYIQNHIK